MEGRDVDQVDANTAEAERQSASRSAGADRDPTPDEERAADEATERLNETGELDEVGRHEKEMNDLGANVKGEGQVA